jgi:hypothetical protein
MNSADIPNVPLKEALDVLAEMPHELQRALNGRSPDALKIRRDVGGEFSLVEHACHLRDLEREGYLVRVQRTLAEEEPELQGFPGGTIAEQRDYLSQDAMAAAGDFAAARCDLIKALAALTPAQLARTAVFGGKTLTMAELVDMIVDHDRGHREEIRRLAESFGVP